MAELESDGRTTNVRTARSGTYSEYGLRDARRVSGKDPTDLGAGSTAEVTVIVQEEETGLVDEADRTIRSSTAWIRTATADAFRADQRAKASSGGSGDGSGDAGTEGATTDADDAYEPPHALQSSTVVSLTGLPRDLDGEKV